MKIGFLGAGNMGYAMLSGIAAASPEGVTGLLAYEPDTAKHARLLDCGASVCSTAAQLCDASDFLVLAVKPQMLKEALSDITVRKDQVIISICAGISADFLRACTIPEARIILVMPNTPLMLGEGATALARCSGVTDEEFSLAKSLFSACGMAVEIPEDKMKEVIAVNSSSPAFLYLFAKGFVDYGKHVGIGEETSLQLFSQAMIGAAKMMTDSGQSIDELIKMVSSPGGTTLAGLEELYQIPDLVENCCISCTNRAYELAGEKPPKY